MPKRSPIVGSSLRATALYTITGTELHPVTANTFHQKSPVLMYSRSVVTLDVNWN